MYVCGKKHSWRRMAAVAATLAAVSMVHAGVTTVQNAAPEPSLLKTLVEVYGAAGATTATAIAPGGSIGTSFTMTGTKAAIGGPVTFTRVQDFGPGGNLNNLVYGGGSTDQVWVDGIARMSARARHAGYHQTFGYTNDLVNGGVDGTFFSAANTTWEYGTAAPTATFQFTHGVPWAWTRQGNSSNPLANINYSLDALNADTPNPLDHMITFRVDGLYGPDTTTWILAWDDQRVSNGNGSDRDFNDLVVEVSATVVPLPGAALLGSLGLGLLAHLRRRFS